MQADKRRFEPQLILSVGILIRANPRPSAAGLTLGLTLAAFFLYRAFQNHAQTAYPGLVHRLNQAQRLIQNSSLMLWPVGLSGDAAALALVKRSAGWPNAFNDLLIDRQSHRRDARLLESARYQRDRLMTKPRSRHEQRCLDLVASHSFQQFRQHLVRKSRRAGDETTETPKDGIELADDSVLLKFEESRQRHLRVDVLVNVLAVIAARHEAQIFSIDLGRYFAKSEIASDCVFVKRISTVEVCPRRRDQREVQHRQRAPRRRERRMRILYKRISLIYIRVVGGSRVGLLPVPEPFPPFINVFDYLQLRSFSIAVD